jgi:uncharacterized protein YecE (DUF72 family)
MTAGTRIQHGTGADADAPAGAASRSFPPGEVFVGTSGWAYDDWNGLFYPPGVRGAERLAHYAQHFDTVEVNVTFYRLPTPVMLSSWNRRLPEGFRLAVKGSRQITHEARLASIDDALSAFLGLVGQLATLRVVLWQLPTSLPKDLPLLQAFLARLAAQPLAASGDRQEIRHAFEFRHASWWDEDVRASLMRNNAAWVTLSHPHLPDTIVPTSDVLYVRFHGRAEKLYDYDYSEAELSSWADRLRPHLPGRTLYAYFNNDWYGHAIRNGLRLRELLGVG